MNENDRITLAKAIGLPISHYIHANTGKRTPFVNREGGQFNPLTNANDDYAVLEWMRVQPQSMFDVFMTYFALQDRTLTWTYKIGDYAKAALTVLGGQ